MHESPNGVEYSLLNTPFNGNVSQIDFINIETTRYCNLQCRMCLQFNDGTTVTGPHMDMEFFRKISSEIFPHISRFQPSVSGEPLMARGFKEMLETSLKYGVRIEICTNATLLTPGLIQLLSQVSGKILISFDGASKDTFEYIRGGTQFEKVVANVKELCDEVNKLPTQARPVVGLACVLMEKNVRELSALVKLGKELGVHFLACSHVHPVTAEMRAQSLAHFPELAKEKIQEALKVAEDNNLPFICNPLDQLIAATAFSEKGAGKRRLASKDGHVEGLGYISWGEDRIPPWPQNPPRSIDSPFSNKFESPFNLTPKKSIKEKPKKESDDSNDYHYPSSIWYCDFLWNKSYIALDGSVRPCCVPGTPNLGNVKDKPFFEIWNSEGYRKMRLRIALKNPLPFCKGCQHIREEKDPEKIAQLLENHPLPNENVLFDRVPAPPEIHWEKAKDILGYEIEASIDSFYSIFFSSGKKVKDLIIENRFQIPEELWKLTPSNVKIWWRVWAHRDGESWTVGSGELIKDETLDQ